MTTLNKNIRVKIVNNVLKHGFADQLMQLSLDYQNLSYKVYDMIADETVQTLSAPWVTRERTNFKIVIGSDVRGFDVSGSLLGMLHSELVNTFTYSSGWWNDKPNVPRKITLPCGSVATFSIADDRLLIGKVDAILERGKSLLATVQTTRSEMNALVGGCRSVKKLLEIWPEVAPFIPENVEKPLQNLPAKADLNKRLGLPV